MKFSLFIQLERKDGRWAASRRTTKPGNAEILNAETIYILFVASVYERTAVLRNFNHLNFFQPITGQKTSWNIKALLSLVERNVQVDSHQKYFCYRQSSQNIAKHLRQNSIPILRRQNGLNTFETRTRQENNRKRFWLN